MERLTAVRPSSRISWSALAMYRRISWARIAGGSVLAGGVILEEGVIVEGGAVFVPSARLIASSKASRASEEAEHSYLWYRVASQSEQGPSAYGM
jgi:hypothetical protein